MPIIKVPQRNLELNVEVGSNLMKSLLAAQVPVASSCSGDGICAKCRMQIVEGIETIAVPNERETHLMDKFIIKDNERISCQVTVTADITVRTTYW